MQLLRRSILLALALVAAVLPTFVLVELQHGQFPFVAVRARVAMLVGQEVVLDQQVDNLLISNLPEIFQSPGQLLLLGARFDGDHAMANVGHFFISSRLGSTSDRLCHHATFPSLRCREGVGAHVLHDLHHFRDLHGPVLHDLLPHGAAHVRNPGVKDCDVCRAVKATCGYVCPEIGTWDDQAGNCKCYAFVRLH